jgi:hypothetical protein
MLSSLLFCAALAPVSASNAGLEEYVVREVRREAVFAGKLGQRVHEQLVLEHNGTTVVVDVKGFYHTMCVHPSARLEAGDRVSARAGLSDGSSVSRDSIRRIARG